MGILRRHKESIFGIDELMLLVSFTYMEDQHPFKNITAYQGMSVGEMLDSIDLSQAVEGRYYGTFLNIPDWVNLFAAARRHPAILNSRIIAGNIDTNSGGGGGISAVFLSEGKEEAVVAFRGTSTYEWYDDFEGANVVDTNQQINALEWYKEVYGSLKLGRYYLTVSGHSKGGNKAKYISILDDTPDRCISFNGQGFSDKFMYFYKDRILERRHIIENHNVDYDYVNLILNDVGERFYYFGYDYGKGGFAESHVINTYFDFGENGEYAIRLNPNGQSPEMRLLDRFFNSYFRSSPSDQERTEAIELFGKLAEKAVAISMGEEPDQNYMNFLCEMIADPVYSNNVAFLFAYIIKYERIHPGFMEVFKRVADRFAMRDLVIYAQCANILLNWGMLEDIIGATGYIASKIPVSILRRISDFMNTRFGTDISTEQVRGMLSIVALTKQMLSSLEINDDGDDIDFAGDGQDDAQGRANGERAGSMNIVVLSGGLSAVRTASLMTGSRISAALRSAGHNVILLDSYQGCSIGPIRLMDPFAYSDALSADTPQDLPEMPDMWAAKKRRSGSDDQLLGPNVMKLCCMADMVFIGLSSDYGENGRLQAALDIYGARYTGSGYEEVTAAIDKNLSKKLFRFAGVNTPAWCCAERGPEEWELPDNMEYPVVVKPMRGGTGMGIFFAWNNISYNAAMAEAFKTQSKVLVEEYIEGREFSVGILGGETLPVIEVSLPDGASDFEDRFDSGKAIISCPARLDPDLEEFLKNEASKAAKALDVGCCCRVDFRLNRKDTLYCLECDPQPDLDEEGLFARAALAAGISYEEMCERILDASQKKYK